MLHARTEGSLEMVRRAVQALTLLVMAVLLPVTLSGCATLFSDDTKSIHVLTSNAQTTQVIVEGREYVVPGVIVLQKDGMPKMLSSQSEDCRDTLLNTRYEDAFWLNALGSYFGLSSSTTDHVTDAMWTYDDIAIVYCEADPAAQ